MLMFFSTYLRVKCKIWNMSNKVSDSERFCHGSDEGSFDDLSWLSRTCCVYFRPVRILTSVIEIEKENWG